MHRNQYTPVHGTPSDDPEGLGMLQDVEGNQTPTKREPLWLQCSDKVQRYRPAWLDYKVFIGIFFAVILIVTVGALFTGAENQCGAPQTPDFELLRDWAKLPRSINATAGTKGVVASDQSRCSRIGAQILKDGGNAVDGAVATMLCLGVVNPIASGLAGGMLMTVQLKNGSAWVINAREVAPANATSDMYEGTAKKDSSRVGGLAVGVPLELKGLWRAHQMFGRLEWAKLMAPAIDLAQNGYEAHPYLVYVMNFALAAIKNSPSVRRIFLKPCGKGEWRLPFPGERCCSRPKLAAFMKQVAAAKTDEQFYTVYNATAEKWAAEIHAQNGVVTAKDIKEAEPKVEQPLVVDIKRLGLRFVAPRPPSSAAVILMALKVLAEYDDMTEDVPRAYVRLNEAMKHAFSVKLFLGDEGYSPLTANVSSVLQEIDTPEYIQAVKSLILDDDIQPLTKYGATYPALACENLGRPEEHGTSQISVVDSEGNAASATTTVNFVFGAKFLSDSTEVVFNNQMDDFFKPGTDSYGRRRSRQLMGEKRDVPAVCGLLDGHPNSIAPGKKPLSSMSPTIVSDPDTNEIVMVTGASGGPLIIGATLQSLFRVLILKQSPWDAVSKGRLFNQLFDGGVPPNCTHCDYTHYENFTMGHIQYKMEPAILDRLNTTGHNLTHLNSEGVSQAVVSGKYLGWDGVEFAGVSDPRKDGAPYAG